MTSDTDLFQVFENVQVLIDRVGWAVMGIGGSPDCPHYVYTVGLAAKGKPELIVFGLPMATGQQILNDLAARMVAGEDFVDGQLSDEVLGGGYQALFLQVANSREHLRMANRFFRRDDPIPALQLVFTDAAHRWPWDPGSGVAYMPVLGTPPEIPA